MSDALMKGIAEGITAGVSGGASSFILNAFTDKEKFDAKQAKADMDTMFPGTSSWERLGGSGASAATSANSGIQIAKQQIKSNEKVAGIKAATERYAVDRQSETAKQVAGISSEAPKRQAALGEARLPTELELLDLETRQRTQSLMIGSLEVIGKQLDNFGKSLQNRINDIELYLKNIDKKYGEDSASKNAAVSSWVQLLHNAIIRSDKEGTNAPATIKRVIDSYKKKLKSNPNSSSRKSRLINSNQSYISG